MKQERTAGEKIASRFELVRRLGIGGFGQVWLARDLENDRQVAIKILLQHQKHLPMILRRFETEARVVSELDHPNIARAVAWSTTHVPAYLVMEYVEGIGLDRVMAEHAKREQFFRAEEISRIFEQLCEGVAHAHARGVVHRDLKPSNVLVQPAAEFRLKILDFGIAKILEEDDAQAATTVGRFLGTPYYLSPEQIHSTGVDQKSDVFALGTVLFELLTLRRAWVVDTQDRPRSLAEESVPAKMKQDRIAAITRIARGPRPRATLVRPDLKPELDQIIARATAPEPWDRYQSVEELLAEFRRVWVVEESPVDPGAITADESPLEDLALDPPAAKDFLTQVMPRDLDTLGEQNTSAPKIMPAAKSRQSPVKIKVTPMRRRTTMLAVAALSVALVSLSIAVIIARPTQEEQVVIDLGGWEDIRAVPVSAQPAPVELPGPPAPPVEERVVRPSPNPNLNPSPSPSPKKQAAKEVAEKPAEPPVDPLKEIDQLLARARGSDDFRRVDALSEAIISHAHQRCPTEEARAIQRCATVASMVSDVEGLARCLDRLRKNCARRRRRARVRRRGVRTARRPR